MDRIRKRFKIKIPPDIAFQKFVGLNQWWPKEYTWSKDKLKEIKIGDTTGGFCTEIGPNGFRCDWGTVTQYIENKKISFKWQISHNREPIPNTNMASDVSVEFDQEKDSTIFTLEHFNFKNHKGYSNDYRKMMASERGWDYILNNYKEYCTKQYM